MTEPPPLATIPGLPIPSRLSSSVAALAILLFYSALVSGVPPDPGATPSPGPTWKMTTWEDEKARGFVPYHQLTVEDFKIKETGTKKVGFVIRPFIDPQYEYILFVNRGWRAAYVKRWHVFSGLDRDETICDPSFHELKAYLPYAQAILDLNEIYARQLAIVPADGFPESHTNTEEKAIAELKAKIDTLCAQSYAALNTETDAFVKATDVGQNKKKTRQLAAEIARRLQSTPQPTPFGAPAPAPPAASPAPSAALPTASPGGNKEP